ncbi:MAG: hypothetical protein Q9227_004167 [Pyrenula ochraceoflavens]
MEWESPSRYASGVQVTKSQTVSWLSSRRSNIPRPLSQATDFEDDEEVFTNPESLAGDSQTTASTPDRIRTPSTGGLRGFDFHFDEKLEKPVTGPVGPHLFRASSQYQDVDFCLGNSPVEVPPPRDISTLNKAIAELDETQVEQWSPLEVANWMADSGFEETVVDKFLAHDISGSILLTLQNEDLKELDITSFGKRHLLMSSIQRLRDSVMFGTPPPQQPQQPDMQECKTPITPEDEDEDDVPRRRRTRHRRNRTMDEVLPAESVSIVAIEQVLPKEHKCSKGENCAKWQKQQRKIQRIKEDFARDTRQREEAANARPKSEAVKSEAEPSVVASSDVLGQSSLPQLRLTEEVLNGVQPVDPQENVQQYLTFQHIRGQSALKAPSPPPARSASLAPPSLPKQSVPLTQHLNSLPKLTIPVTEQSNMGPYTPAVSSHSRRQSKSSLSAGRRLMPSPCMQNSPYHYMPQASSSQELDIPRYNTYTPFSETDAPITAFHISDPIGRETSQSVPAEMRYGAPAYPSSAPPPPDNMYYDPISRPSSAQPLHAEPISRPSSTAPQQRPYFPPPPQQALSASSSRPTRRPSFAHPTIARLSEAEEPPASATIAHSAPSLPQGCTYAGPMRKRKTHKLIRHEWNDGHFTLTGTRLAMFKDESDAARQSRALECIDVDDYAVACSSLASSSKLSAAFKKSILGKNYYGGEQGLRDQAFAFSLVPSKDKEERKRVDGKSHHFSVKNREERIEWMRELMLAKARAKGRREGGHVKLNGEMI